ncbi:MAG: HIT family protein [Desulfobacteraceae bacterium 4572_89]|nr:MAG: HIT family protein [Desulfobacteraceae bacterium 4572_89]
MNSNPTLTCCLFCKINPSNLAGEQGSVYAIPDTSPVSEGHVLIIPRRHCETYFDLTAEERRDAHTLITRLRKKIMENDPLVTGFNIGVNCGETAGQTIFHTHIHLIPRRENDTPCPRGGVRGVIPDRMNY